TVLRTARRGERTLEVDVTRAIVGRVGIGEVRCQYFGALRTQLQRCSMHSEVGIQIDRHGDSVRKLSRTGYSKLHATDGQTAPTLAPKAPKRRSSAQTCDLNHARAAKNCRRQN